MPYYVDKFELDNQEILIKDSEATYRLDLLDMGANVNFIAPSKNADFGDCTVINTKDKNIIIDLGNDMTCAPLINYLMAQNINKIDYVILTHYHEDHIGGGNAEGLSVFLSNNYFDFSECTFILPHGNINYTSAVPSGSLDLVRQLDQNIISLLQTKNISYIKPNIEGYTINLDETQRLIFHNVDSTYFNEYYNYTLSFNTTELNKTNYNNFSLVTILENENNSALFTGDIEYPAEANIAKYLKNISLMKIEHHGLNTRTSNDYIDVLAPKYIIVCNRQFYDTSQDYERDTVANLLLKGALCFDTRSIPSSYLRFKLTKNDVISYQEASSLTWNPALNLLAGKQLLEGQDLNLITDPGTYYSSSAERTASLINKPETIDGVSSIGTGFKMIVMRTYNTDGDYLTQFIVQSNAIFSRVYIRNSINGSFTDSYWQALIPSVEQYYDNTYFDTTNPKTYINNLYKNIASANTWLVKKNGYVTINFDITINENIGTSYINLLAFKYNLARPTANVEFALHDNDGNIYPMYLRYNNNEIQMRTRGKAIASGTTLRGCVTYALNRVTS